jgi:uncharacterized YigZ family protein
MTALKSKGCMFLMNFLFTFFMTHKSGSRYAMSVLSFFTIQSDAEGLYKEKGSKFLAFAYPVTTEIEIKGKIDHLKKKYFDARHHCFAWILGSDKKRFRAFDDGEPNHSAGDPILGQIRSKDLSNVLIVVVRYFGGTKLGVGGLIAAYKLAAEDALNHARIIEQEVTETLMLTYNYTSTPEVMRMVKDFNLQIIEQDFQKDCSMRFAVKLRDKDSAIDKIKLLQATGHVIKIEDSYE